MARPQYRVYREGTYIKSFPNRDQALRYVQDAQHGGVAEYEILDNSDG